VKVYQLTKSPNKLPSGKEFVYWKKWEPNPEKVNQQEIFYDGIYKFEIIFDKLPSLNSTQYLTISEQLEIPVIIPESYDNEIGEGTSTQVSNI
jgi:hypothetical protein